MQAASEATPGAAGEGGNASTGSSSQAAAEDDDEEVVVVEGTDAKRKPPFLANNPAKHLVILEGSAYRGLSCNDWIDP